MKKAIFLLPLLCVLFSVNAQARAKNVWDMAESEKYGEKAGGMLGRGILNAASSPVDMAVQTVRGATEDKPEFIGAVGGFAKGAVCTILRASSGVIDVGTFWVPSFNGLPVCRSYEDCLNCPAPLPAAPPARAYQPPAPKPVVQQTAPPPQPVKAVAAESAPEKYFKTEGREKYIKK